MAVPLAKMCSDALKSSAIGYCCIDLRGAINTFDFWLVAKNGLNDFLTQYMDAPQLLFHDGRIDLAHVASIVLGLDVFDEQIPGPLLIVRHPDTLVVRNHPFV